MKGVAEAWWEDSHDWKITIDVKLFSKIGRGGGAVLHKKEIWVYEGNLWRPQNVYQMS